MRYVLAAMILAAATVANAAGSVPKLPKGAFYYNVRDSLTALGWQPAPLPANKRGCTGGREDVCDRYPEAASCSGTGLALCTFLWRRGDTLAEVTTYGEEVDMIRVRSVECRAGC
ncbi:hypothetical protein MKK88_16180 [Methylobacterium sp. E-005]|uniref:hypothetical protein n=1 Tax=Methylobacterium sp. E-005 TaxID=2836549 RepID=UPI001FBA3559|nr:hypothetical protein [Methylobacterium sp. E-005]MCJ2087507.1 hypothetical protein [Methylobacterium sp. E-005]